MAWPPGVASPDQLGLSGESRGLEHPGEAAGAVPGVQPGFQRGEVAADHGGDDLAMGVGGTGAELTQERPVPEGDCAAEPAQRPGVGVVQPDRRYLPQRRGRARPEVRRRGGPPSAEGRQAAAGWRRRPKTRRPVFVEIIV